MYREREINLCYFKPLRLRVICCNSTPYFILNNILRILLLFPLLLLFLLPFLSLSPTPPCSAQQSHITLSLNLSSINKLLKLVGYCSSSASPVRSEWALAGDNEPAPAKPGPWHHGQCQSSTAVRPPSSQHWSGQANFPILLLDSQGSEFWIRPSPRIPIHYLIKLKKIQKIVL